jgi:hypothetical protein
MAIRWKRLTVSILIQRHNVRALKQRWCVGGYRRSQRRKPNYRLLPALVRSGMLRARVAG